MNKLSQLQAELVGFPFIDRDGVRANVISVTKITRNYAPTSRKCSGPGYRIEISNGIASTKIGLQAFTQRGFKKVTCDEK